jgi:hypothetical protein
MHPGAASTASIGRKSGGAQDCWYEKTSLVTEAGFVFPVDAGRSGLVAVGAAAAILEAFPAIHRLASGRLEWDLGLFAALAANRRVHLARTAAVAVATAVATTTASAAAVAVATVAAAAAAVAAATVAIATGGALLLAGRAARRAAQGLRIAALGIERLLAGSEYKGLAAIAAGERSITHGCGLLLKERRNTSPGTKWTR